MQGLIRPGQGEKRRWPSYVPSRTFVASLLSLGGQAADAAPTTRDVQASIKAIPNERVRTALTTLLQRADLLLNVDTVQIARHLWSDEAVRNAVVASANAEAADQRAQPEDIEDIAKTINQLDELRIPLGWSFADDATPETQNPQRLIWPWSDWEWSLAKLIGLVLTVAGTLLVYGLWRRRHRSR